MEWQLTLFTRDTEPDFWKHLIQWTAPIGGSALLVLLVLKLTTPGSSSPATPAVEEPQLTPRPALPPRSQSVQRPPAIKPQQLPPQPRSAEVPQQPVRPTALRAPAPPQKIPALTLRVAIATEADSLTIGASTPATVLDAQGRRLGQILTGQALIAQPDGAGFRLGEWQDPAWIQPTGKGAVYVGERWYRGRVQLTREGSKLLAVNHVDLDQYLYSVVGGEMPAHWPLEALKAQAIAARSYALVHMVRPAHALYDLGATTRWQQYEGIQAEANTTQAAVNQTRGLLLSYQGGVVESMYAASDQIVTDIFGGRGMSQNGAYKLAAQGYDYMHILGAYYPGTGLSHLQTR